jgi:hypothetical protein
MPIDTRHPAYNEHVSRWQRCRDITEGADAVKARGVTYLPRLSEQTDEEYDAYKMRAYWFGGGARTIQGLTGAVMRKDPTTETPAILDEFLKNVTQTGLPFPAFVKTTLEEVLKTGRYGVLVEMPGEQTSTPTPYWCGYHAEQIVNWQTEYIQGIPQLIMVVLCEAVVEEDPTDPYVLKTIEQYRELWLEPLQGGTYQYKQQLWRRMEGGEAKAQEWVRYGDEIIPMFRQSPLPYIPFCFMSPTTITPAIDKPPILDLADANLSHYRSSADLEHGRHFCGLPTPWVAGFPEKMKLPIGSSVAWVSSDPNANAGMLEFTGQGLGALESALKDKKQDMAILGARLLEPQQPSTEAADTLQTRLAGEQSVLQSVANTLSMGFSQLLNWTAYWLGAGEASKKATAKINTDLLDIKMTFTELTELVKSWQSGALSYETMYYNMERGGITRPGIKWEKEKAQIEIEQPVTVPQNIDPLTGLPREDMNPDGTPKTNGQPFAGAGVD